MKFAEMDRPSILDESVELGLAIARDIDPEGVARYENRIKTRNQFLLLEQEEQRRTSKLASVAMQGEDSSEGFSEHEEMHFLRCKMFLTMLRETGERGIDPLTPEQFGRCFEQNEKHEDRNDIARISRDLKNILGELEGIAIVHGVKLR